MFAWFDFSLLDGARIEAHFGHRLGRSALRQRIFPARGHAYCRPAMDGLARRAFRVWLCVAVQAEPEFGARCRGPLEHRALVAARFAARRSPRLCGSARPFARCARRAACPNRRGRRAHQFQAGRRQEPLRAASTFPAESSRTARAAGNLTSKLGPMRAGVELQDIGTLRLRGSIAGTTARLQPAELNLTWRAASLADTLRLVREDDYGMRGQLAVDLTARIAPPDSSPIRGADSGGAQWSISGVARLTGMHGWRLPERDTDPAANLSVEMNWRLGERRAEIRKLLVEMPAFATPGSR